MKGAEEGVETLGAFELVRTLRRTAELEGCAHKMVANSVARGRGGGTEKIAERSTADGITSTDPALYPTTNGRRRVSTRR